MNLSLNPIASNFNSVEVGSVTVWFSYKTAIAFSAPGLGTIVRQNEWSTTTDKHLNRVDGGGKDAKDARVDGETFNNWLSNVLKINALV